MTWLAWRQFRGQAAAGAAALALLGVVLLLSGPGLADSWNDGLARCGDDCASFTDGYLDQHQSQVLAVTGLVLVVPAILGLFWGAPLVAREVDSGTHRLVWNQSVTRVRWLTAKLLLVGGAVAAVAGLVTWAINWWSDPLDAASLQADARLPWALTFSAHGIVPVAYALFAFALGVCVGILTRRALPAMAITLAVFVTVQVAVPTLVRAHLTPPETTTAAITADTLANFTLVDGDRLHIDADAPEPGSWLISRRTVDASGRTVDSLPASLTTRPECAATKDVGSCLQLIARLGYRQVSTYHPPSHFWPLQRAEAGLYAAMTAALVALSFWWVRRRVA
jgi:hypothetical protein